MNMTLDQARAHLEGKRNMWRFAAMDARRNGDEYKLSANIAENSDLARVQFENSSRCYANAREMDADVEALNLILEASQVKS